jgi:hypothetical protein
MAMALEPKPCDSLAAREHRFDLQRRDAGANVEVP